MLYFQLLRQKGLSLIELLYALVLSLCITAFLLQIYSTENHVYTKYQRVLDARFETLYVSDLIADSVHHAGFSACLSLANLDFGEESLYFQPLSFNDQVLHVQRMATEFAEIVSLDNPFSVQIYPKKPWRVGQKLIIADCSQARWNSIQSIEHRGNSSVLVFKKALPAVFKTPVFVGLWMDERFFLKQGTFYYQNQKHKEPLTEDIKAFSGTVQGAELHYVLQDKHKKNDFYLRARSL